MAFEFKLPDIGEGVVEGELVKWLVDEGQAVQEDTELFEILTDKVSAVIPSPRRGLVSKRCFKEGEIVPVGAVVLTIEVEGGSASATPEAPATAPAATSSAPAVTTSAPAAPVAVAAPQRTSAERVRATPATRKLARTLNVDIGQVPGSGDGGRVTREDVQRWADAVTAAPARARSPLTAEAPVRTVPIIGLRRRISTAMRASRDLAAHFTYVEEVDFTEVVALKDALRERGLGVTFLPFVMKAVAIVLRRAEFANLNAHVDHDAGELRVHDGVHLGIATATEAGLLVPVIADVHQKSIRDLVAELTETGEATRNKKIAVGRLSGSTFTITSLGKLGGMFATPIINQPEVAILGLHNIEKRPVVVDDQIIIRQRMYMSCSFDHRIIDGHVGAAFVQAVRELIERPALLMAELV